MKSHLKRTLPSPRLRRASRIIVALAATLALTLNAAPKSDPAKVMFEAAKKEEVVNGDLNAAIAQYRAIIEKHKTDRATVADALIRMAECYQKLGDTESRKIYEHVVKDFADQKDAVELARTRLGVEPRAGESRISFRQMPELPKKGSVAGAVSRDGRYLPYVDWAQNGDLFLHDFSSGTNRRLTNTATDGLPQPNITQFVDDAALSSDGRRMAYNWYREDIHRYELRLIDIVGDGIPQSRLLLENPEISWLAPMDWSPDGKWIAVSMKRVDKTAQIGLVSALNGTLRVLKSVDWRGSGRIYFSPDGKYVAFDLPENDVSPARDVFVLSVDGAREVHAVAHPSNDAMMGWSPDGRWLLFASDRTGSMSLWGLPFADGKPQGTPELLRADIAPRAEPMGVTQSGALFYNIRGKQDRFSIEIGSFDFSTGKYTVDPAYLPQDYLESNALPRWSVDGRQLAYKSLRGPAQKPTHEVVVIRSLETGQVRELRPKLSYFGPMEWSPDASSFVALGGDLKGRSGVFQIDVKTGEATALLLKSRQGERLWYPVWAHDGKSFIVQRDAPSYKTYIRYELATGQVTELIRRPVLTQAELSPDGNYIATRSIDEATNSRTVLLVPIAGGEVRELMRYPSEVAKEDLAAPNKGMWMNPLFWAPDSRSFVAINTRHSGGNDRSLETWLFPVDGGERRKLDNSFGDSFRRDTGNGRPKVAPDGRHIGFTVTETTPQRDPEIWALDNFLPTVMAKK